MGWTVLYLAFGLVALWLLGEVLLQYKARLRWRLLAFCGFLAVVCGVVLPSVAVIAAGAVAFAVGQTLVTLSFRKGFSTGWALGGGPGTSRRRREVRPMEPLDDTGELEVYQEYPGEGYGYGYDRDDTYDRQRMHDREPATAEGGHASVPEPGPAQPAGAQAGAHGYDSGYAPTEQYPAVDYDYPQQTGAAPAVDTDRFAYAETAEFGGFPGSPDGSPGLADQAAATSGGATPYAGDYGFAVQGSDTSGYYPATHHSEYGGVPYGAATAGGYGTEQQHNAATGYGYGYFDQEHQGGYPGVPGQAGTVGYGPTAAGYAGFPHGGGQEYVGQYQGYPSQNGYQNDGGYAAGNDSYGWSGYYGSGYGNGYGSGWTGQEEQSETPPGGVWMPQQRDGVESDAYGHPSPAAQQYQGYYYDGHRY